MRLIDADVLLKALRVNEDEWGTPDETWRPEREYGGAIKTAPTIDPAKEKDFVDELIGYIFAYPDDDYMTIETLCRKLYKHGLIDKKDGEWTCNFIEPADTPQTEREGDR